jgi:CheY-like chemotaxis protein
MQTASKMTILCIDDDQTGLVIRKMMLESRGYNVLTADNGAEGLQVMSRSKVDAVVLDYQMPSMSGVEVARSIRERAPNLPMVMLSGYPDDVPEDALHLVDVFMTKGGEPEQLLKVIDGVLGDPDHGRITILNVDDNQGHRYAISRVLRQAGFDVMEAETGREALAVASSRPSLIILDVNLPDMLGFDVCRELKTNPATRDIPVVHISATYPAHSIGPESVQSGAGRFIEHPRPNCSGRGENRPKNRNLPQRA